MKEEDFHPNNNLMLVKKLHQNGFVKLPCYLNKTRLKDLQETTKRLYSQEGKQAGAEFKTEPGSIRLANLVQKSEIFRDLIVDPIVLAWVEIVIGREFKLSSLNARKALSHNKVSQPLHCDMGAIPDKAGFWVCNSIWMLDEFREDNGPTRVVPGSHLIGQLPTKQILSQYNAVNNEESVLGPVGSVVIMNAHLWHGGGENKSPFSRTALHSFYVRRDKPQQQYQKELLTREVQNSLSEKQRWILALDDSLNDELAGSDAPRSGFME